MILGNNWTEVATGSCVLQKAGTKIIQLKYSATKPTDTLGSFIIVDNEITTLGQVPSKNLWARAPEGSVHVSVEATLPDNNLPADTIRGGWATYFNGDVSLISLSANVPTQLTMDTGTGESREEFLPLGTTSLWDSLTNSLDFSSLSIGDMLDIRLDGTINTPGFNDSYLAELHVAVGSASEFVIPIASGSKLFGGESLVSRYVGMFVGSQDVIDYPTKLFITSTASAGVRLDDIYIKVLRTSG